MNVRITAILIATMTLLKFADSLMPMTSKNVMNPTINMAGTLSTAPVLTQPSVNSRQMFHHARRAGSRGCKARK